MGDELLALILSQACMAHFLQQASVHTMESSLSGAAASSPEPVVSKGAVSPDGRQASSFPPGLWHMQQHGGAAPITGAGPPGVWESRDDPAKESEVVPVSTEFVEASGPPGVWQAHDLPGTGCETVTVPAEDREEVSIVDLRATRRRGCRGRGRSKRIDFSAAESASTDKSSDASSNES